MPPASIWVHTEFQLLRVSRQSRQVEEKGDNVTQTEAMYRFIGIYFMVGEDELTEVSRKRIKMKLGRLALIIGMSFQY